MPFSHVRAQTSEREDVAKFQLYTACQPMSLAVEGLSDHAEDIGLSEQAVVNAAESRLRAARLYSPNPSGRAYLYVRITVASSAFSIEMSFKKQFFDGHSGISLNATTWDEGSTGTHGRDASYILGSLSEHMDEFLVEFLRVNEPACSDSQ